ncbi:MAG TPA: DUF1697 domain-containing protein [Miltoncostaeaceae bacterium]|jgi:uncharacterized protein (DUF1697 family)|nr:DUF1697 domain-containing protein [Miltoncostaeaceae bacterium]
MPRYVALLRGVNVGGRGRMAMADLRACAEGAGFADVATHIQSGNVLFRTPMRSAEKVAVALEGAVEAGLGFRTSAMVRTAAQLTAALEARPFPDADPATLHIAFLRDAPAAAAAAAFTAPPGPDEAAVIGSEVHLRYADGMGRSKLTGAFIEKALGVPATARRRNVVETIRDLLRAGA